MTDEQDKILCEKFPKMFADRDGKLENTCMFWGFQCDSGWFDLIYTLCETIQSYIDHNQHLNINQVVVEQVKEKFGTLRFYVRGGNDMTDGMIWFAELIVS